MKILNKLFKSKIIVNCNRQPYLTRWYIFRRERFAIFLHRFWRSDDDRALHDHPWSFITFIIWKGYLEHTDKKEMCWLCMGDGKDGFFSKDSCVDCNGQGFNIRRKISRKWPLMICWRPAEWKHRVELINEKPAWTIVFRFKERRIWGFWEKTGFVAWNKWWQNNCE